MGSDPTPVGTPPEEVRRIARLAGLDLGEAEIARLASELGAILGYMASLAEAGGGPAGAAVAVSEPPAPLREDAPEPCLGTGAALANAPDVAASLFRVPRSLGE